MNICCKFPTNSRGMVKCFYRVKQTKMNIRKIALRCPILTLQCYGMNSFQESIQSLSNNSAKRQFINNNTHDNNTSKFTDRTISPMELVQPKQTFIQKKQAHYNQPLGAQQFQRNATYNTQYLNNMTSPDHLESFLHTTVNSIIQLQASLNLPEIDKRAEPYSFGTPLPGVEQKHEKQPSAPPRMKTY